MRECVHNKGIIDMLWVFHVTFIITSQVTETYALEIGIYWVDRVTA